MTNRTPERRRDPRVPARVQVQLVQGKSEISLLTDDVSLQGLRLRTDLRLSPRALVKMKIPIGDDGSTLPCQGMIVHVIEPADGVAPSLGIQFYAFDGAVRDGWTKLVAKARSDAEEQAKLAPAKAPPAPAKAPPAPAKAPPPVPAKAPPPARAMPPVPGKAPPPMPGKAPPPLPAAPAAPAKAPPPVPMAEPVRRRWERKRAKVAVYIGSLDDLISFTTHDVSRGGMFLATTHDVPVGTRLSLEMRSEDTNPFVVEAVVRRSEPAGDPAGLALEFVSDDPPADLARLVEEAVDEDADEEPVFVATYDPNLA